MQHINLAKLAPLAPRGLGDIAFETGTFLGKGTRFLASHFPRVITIELSEELHREAKTNLADLGQIECLRGNSVEVLARLLPSFGPDASAFFFLDAHWSGDDSVDWESSRWKGFRRNTAHLGSGPLPSGPEQCPLLEELALITREWRGEAYILIDDTRNIPKEGPGKKDFAFLGEDWSHLTRDRIYRLIGNRLGEVHELLNPDQIFLSLKKST